MGTKSVKARLIMKHATESTWNKVGSNRTDGKEPFVPLEGEFIVYDRDAEHDYARLKIGGKNKPVDQLEFLYIENAAHADVAAQATKLETARNIELAGHLSGNADFDGSSDITINAQITTPLEGTFTPEGEVSKPDVLLTGTANNGVLEATAQLSGNPVFTGTQTKVSVSPTTNQ